MCTFGVGLWCETPAASGPPGFHTTARELQTCTFCEGCLMVGCDHGPQAEVAQGVGPGPLVER